jgi:hypothetical protein
MVLYQICVFGAELKSSMAASGMKAFNVAEKSNLHLIACSNVDYDKTYEKPIIPVLIAKTTTLPEQFHLAKNTTLPEQFHGCFCYQHRNDRLFICFIIVYIGTCY